MLAKSRDPSSASPLRRAGLAGDGVKAGTTYGETDSSYNVTENPVHVNDLNATILHYLGIDHSRFTHKFQGLDPRLTGFEPAKVIKDVLA